MTALVAAFSDDGTFTDESIGVTRTQGRDWTVILSVGAQSKRGPDLLELVLH